MIEKAVNFTDSDMVTVPRRLKVRPENETTSLAYVTKDEEKLLKKNKPGTPHKGPEGVPNYNGGDVLTYTPSFTSSSYVGPSQQQQQQQQQQNQQIQQQVVDTFNRQQGTNQQDTYTPPSEIYGPDQGGAGVSYEYYPGPYQQLSEGFLNQLNLAGLSPETLKFFGVNENSKRIPVELMQMIMEGSVTNQLDYFADKDPNTPGIQFGNEFATGTFSDIEAGKHSMFPGGRQDYYSVMSMPQTTTYDPYSFRGGSGGGFNYGYGRGGGGGGGSGFGYNMNMGMQGQPKQRAQIGPGGLQEQVNQAFLSGGKPFAKGGIVSLVED